ncbi:hypothetical protein CEP52_008573 [Fusarium oligoseptatum]|uniref:CHAT domain-containing protein n=1 Tax=Fusarium oligoseptatum TaxID=2604345 RepID=A0A428TH05_9HYPO|nr:hypothetical protein CEP52_008573 [Fusarium oligoseptatum]
MMPDLKIIKPQSDPPHFYSFQQYTSRPNSFARLFDSCMEEYRRASDVDEIDGTIDHLGDALEPGTGINVAQALLRLAAAYAEKRRRTGTTVDQYASAVMLREASCAIPDDDAEKAVVLDLAATANMQLSVETDDLDDISLALQLLENILHVDSETELRATVLEYLGTFRHTLSKITHDNNILDEAIRNQKESLNLTPTSTRDWEWRCTLLVRASQTRFDTMREMEHLQTLIEHRELLLKNLPHDHPDKTTQEILYAGNCCERAIRTGDQATLERAIEISDSLLFRLPDDHPQRGFALFHQARAYAAMHDITWDMAFLDIAVREFSDGLRRIPKGTRGRQGWVQHASKVAQTLYIKNKESESLEMVSSVVEEELEYLPDNWEGRGETLRLLATVGFYRCERNREAAVLAEAIRRFEELLAQMPSDDPSREDEESRLAFLHVMEKCSQGEFVPSVKPDSELKLDADLEASVKEMKDCFGPIPGLLDSPALAYDFRYDMTGDEADLDQAIQLYNTSLSGTPEGSENKPRLLHSIGTCYFRKYMGRNALTDLTTAVRYLEQALDESPNDTNSLDYAHLDDAITTFQKSLQIAKLHGMAASGLLMNLAEAHDRRYELHGKDEDWKQQIQCLGDFLHEQSEEKDPRYRWKCFERLGQAYHEYLEKAVADSRQNTDRSSHADEELFEIYASLEDWPRAFRSASAMISHLLASARCAGLASGAAAVALRAGESPYTALRLLESGRGIMINSLLGLRSDVDELRRDHPEEAEQYLKLRNQVDSVRPGLSHPAAAWLPVHQPDYRHGAAQALEKAIQDIRTLSGFESFLEGPSEEDMKAAATEGPIIVINVSKYGCDAIIIKTDNLIRHSFSKVTMADIQREAVDATNMSSRVLEWLWDEIAKPVLDKLDSLTTCSEGGSWPHVRWVTTGPLSRLPLHAAGYHLSSRHLGRTVIDRVISSYSVSLTALVQSRKSIQDQIKLEREPAVYRKPESVVLIAMEELYNAPEEARQIANICRSMSISRPESSRQQVLEALKCCDIFHFAGHGTSNDEDPSESSLKLMYPDRLTVSNLFEINLHKRRPFLAYLSACSTGEVKQDDFIDEGLHLISAFQIAGFHHVIGTLWEVRDETCLRAAASVYKSMHVDGMSHGSVAEALHYATRQLRGEWVARDSESRGQLKYQNREGKIEEKTGETRKGRFVEEGPLFWVPYVHYGM